VHVLILGAGVVGVTTAYYLAQQGCDVTVIDREDGVASAASYANAGQLSYSFTDSLAKPSFFAELPGLLLGREPGSKVRLDPALIGWGLRFLANCNSRRAASNTIALLKIAMRSGELMQDFLQAVPIEFSHRAAGKLILLSNEKQLRSAHKSCALKRANGCETDVLTRQETLSIEPTLADINEDFIASIYSKDDTIADSFEFTNKLRGHLESTGRVSFRLGAKVCGINATQGRFSTVALENDATGADAVVVCAGVQSAALLRPLGIRLPMYPVRGYSLTLPVADATPSASYTVLRRRMVIGRIGGSVRVAGFADFVGYRTDADQERTAALLKLAREVAPGAADYEAADCRPWAGNRPMTPNGRPFVGPSKVKGLYLNTGHGMLGWTLAHACAADVAAAVMR
jgi:D-amino-acid dehydrogenase